jgi:hypothetical protein
MKFNQLKISQLENKFAQVKTMYYICSMFNNQNQNFMKKSVKKTATAEQVTTLFQRESILLGKAEQKNPNKKKLYQICSALTAKGENFKQLRKEIAESIVSIGQDETLSYYEGLAKEKGCELFYMKETPKEKKQPKKDIKQPKQVKGSPEITPEMLSSIIANAISAALAAKK